MSFNFIPHSEAAVQANTNLPAESPPVHSRAMFSRFRDGAMKVISDRVRGFPVRYASKGVNEVCNFVGEGNIPSYIYDLI